MLRIGIDTGGTFTDFVVAAGRRIHTWKVPSTPDDPSEAILAGLADAISLATGARGEPAEIIHGSTVATNALLEGKTARVAFITNRGFEDLLEIGRQTRPDLYEINVRKPEVLASRKDRFGLKGRVLADGSEESPIDPSEVETLGRNLAQEGIESAAVCLLHSYAFTGHEEAVATVLRRHGINVSVSSEIVREYREYERASTVTVNAAVAPVVSGYLERLASGLENADEVTVAGLRVMGSNGGALSLAAAGREAVRTVLSGPAAGVRGAEHIGRSTGLTDLITFDMGGTSTDVSLVPGKAGTTPEATVAGYPVKIPTIDIHTVGAGGGSIAWKDPGGALRVGPQSAGARPGPACYGHGGAPTVTDANLVLGRLVPERFLDGRMSLDTEAATDAIGRLAGSLGLSVRETAEGILSVAEAAMARAIRVISLYRGFEPSDFVLMGFGGAGGLHAASLAAALGIERVIIPAEPGVFSAFGMTVADVMRDRSVTLLVDPDVTSAGEIEQEFLSLEKSCLDDLEQDGVAQERIRFERMLDVRYRGQAFELSLPFETGGRWIDQFHDEHERRFGYARRRQQVELVNLRVTGIGEVDQPPADRIKSTGRSLDRSRTGARPVIIEGEESEAAVHERSLLPPDEKSRVAGPALIVEAGATTFVPSGWTGWIDERQHLHLEAKR